MSNACTEPLIRQMASILFAEPDLAQNHTLTGQPADGRKMALSAGGRNHCCTHGTPVLGSTLPRARSWPPAAAQISEPLKPNGWC
jgi:hypothetical protein